MRIPYKPFKYQNPVFPTQTIVWRPVLNVKVVFNHSQSKKFEAIVDSGSDYCLFHGSIGANIGIDVNKGAEGPLGSVIRGLRTKVYYHKVKLLIGQDGIEIIAGFSWDLSDNLLGQIGFFDNYKVVFDPVPQPPWFEFERVRTH